MSSMDIWDGSQYLTVPGTPGPQSFAHVGSEPPADPVAGQMWVDDSANLIDQWDDEWQYPVLLNGWQNYGGDYGTPRFRRTVGGLVIVEGLVKNGPIGSTPSHAVFNLPAGYRTDYRHVIAGTCNPNGSDARINVDYQDILSILVGNTSWTSISVYYRADH